MFSLEQNFFFVLNVLDLFLLQQEILIDPLHGVHFAHFWTGDQENFSERTFVDNFADFEILECDSLSLGTRFSDQTRTILFMKSVSFFVQISLRVVF